MAEVIDFEDLKKDSGDLKKLEDSELQKLSKNIQKLLLENLGMVRRLEHFLLKL